MKEGILIGTQFEPDRDLSTVGDELATQVGVVRDAGYDSVHVSEHHVTAPDQYLLNEAVVAHVASHAGHLELGTSISLLPLHDPVRLAEFGATVDVLTGGGFRLGVGLGYRDAEYRAFGVDPGDAVSRLVEGVEVIEALWTRDEVTYDGDHVTLDGVGIRPRPVQEPRPPIWVGASNEPGIRRAARIADGFIGAHVPLDTARRQVEAFRDERAGTDRGPGEVGLIREAFVGETTAHAEATVRDALTAKYAGYSSWGQDEVIEGDDFDSPWDRLKHERFLVGDASEVAAGVERYRRALDLDHLVLRMQFPGMVPEVVRGSIERFADEVRPAV